MDSLKCSTSTHLFTLVSLHSSTLIPIFIIGGWSRICERYTSMNGNQRMEYYVRPRHIYPHSRTCTHISLCIRPSSLVAFHICYLLDHANVHDVSALMIWFQCMSDIFNHYGDLDPLYVFSSMEILIHCISSSWRFWSIYIVRGNDHTCHILYHAYSWPLYSYVSGTAICTCSLVLYYLMVGSSTWFFITPLLGWTYNVLRPSYHPSDLTH